MAQGPGRYDDHCTKVREATGAKGVILLVLDGQGGTGFSVQAEFDITQILPSLLRDVALQIEIDMEKAKEIGG